jgi:hypothetical protein
MTMQKAHHVVHNPLSAMNPRKKSPSKSASKSVPKSASKSVPKSASKSAPKSASKSTSHSAPKTVTRSATKNVMRIGGIGTVAKRPSTTTRVAKRVVPAKRAAAPAKLVRSPSGARKTGARKTGASTRKTGGGAVLQNWVGLTPVNQAYYSSVLARK